MSREAGPAEEVLLGLIRICNDLDPARWGLPVNDPATEQRLLAVVEAAIQAAVATERERCIETVRTVGTDWRVWATCDTPAHFVEKVAAAIRTGELQT